MSLSHAFMNYGDARISHSKSIHQSTSLPPIAFIAMASVFPLPSPPFHPTTHFRPRKNPPAQKSRRDQAPR